VAITGSCCNSVLTYIPDMMLYSLYAYLAVWWNNISPDVSELCLFVYNLFTNLFYDSFCMLVALKRAVCLCWWP